MHIRSVHFLSHYFLLWSQLSFHFYLSVPICRSLAARELPYRCYFGTMTYPTQGSRLVVGCRFFLFYRLGKFVNCGLRIRRETRSVSHSGRLLNTHGSLQGNGANAVHFFGYFYETHAKKLTSGIKDVPNQGNSCISVPKNV